MNNTEKLIQAANKAAYFYKEKHGLPIQELEDLASIAFMKLWENKEKYTDKTLEYITTAATGGIIDELRRVGRTNQIRTPAKIKQVIKLGSIEKIREDDKYFDIKEKESTELPASEELLEYLTDGMIYKDIDIMNVLYGKDRGMVQRTLTEASRILGVSRPTIHEKRNQFREYIKQHKPLEHVV